MMQLKLMTGASNLFDILIEVKSTYVLIFIKCRYSEKATKIWPIFHFLFDITYIVATNHKWKMGFIFVAFSGYEELAPLKN